MCFWPPLTVRAVFWELQRRIHQGDVFTAYDVCRAVRASGIEARHSDIRRLVHALYEEGHFGDVYVRTRGAVGDGATAFLYHPPTITPELYALGVQCLETLLPQSEGPAPE